MTDPGARRAPHREEAGRRGPRGACREEEFPHSPRGGSGSGAATRAHSSRGSRMVFPGNGAGSAGEGGRPCCLLGATAPHPSVCPAPLVRRRGLWTRGESHHPFGAAVNCVSRTGSSVCPDVLTANRLWLKSECRAGARGVTGETRFLAEACLGQNGNNPGLRRVSEVVGNH